MLPCVLASVAGLAVATFACLDQRELLQACGKQPIYAYVSAMHVKPALKEA